jgi:hypothetical protein
MARGNDMTRLEKLGEFLRPAARHPACIVDKSLVIVPLQLAVIKCPGFEG